MRKPKFWISLAILLVIGLHLVPVISNERQRATRWPILKWAMYKNPRPAGPVQADLRRVTGRTLKGQEDTVTPYLVGLSQFAFSRRYLEPMRAGNSSAAQALATRLNHTRDDPFVELRVESETYRITAEGIVRTENPDIIHPVDPGVVIRPHTLEEMD